MKMKELTMESIKKTSIIKETLEDREIQEVINKYSSKANKKSSKKRK
jgi:hypothetical protein